MKRVTKLVLPVAGLGKRLMPLTKRIPKNLIRVNGKPLLEYVLEEAVSAGMREVILIVNPKHKSHFERYLRANKKRFPTLSFHIRIQETPGGNGHALVSAYDLIANEPFAVRFCDDILCGEALALRSLVDIYDRYQASVVLLEAVPWSKVSRFGVVGLKKANKAISFHGGRVYQIGSIVEKPKAKNAPSRLIILGGYVLTPQIIRNLKTIVDTLPVIADDAIPLALALQIEFIIGGKVYGWQFPGKRLDCGTLEKLRESEAVLQSGK